MRRWLRVFGLLCALAAGGPQAQAAGPEQCRETEESWESGKKQTGERAFQIFRATLQPARNVFDAVSSGGLDACMRGLFDGGVAGGFTAPEFDLILTNLFRALCAMANDWIEGRLNALLAQLNGQLDGFRLRAGFLGTLGQGHVMIRVRVHSSVSRNPWIKYSR